MLSQAFRTPFHFASQYGRVDILKLFFEADCNVAFAKDGVSRSVYLCGSHLSFCVFSLDVLHCISLVWGIALMLLSFWTN